METTANHLYKRVTEEMHRIGTPAHVRGHNYLRMAILLAYEDESYLWNVMNRLYPEIARKYHKSMTSVERGIRNAIEITWNRRNAAVLEEVFGNTVSYSKSKPTNVEFIAMIVDRLKTEDMDHAYS